MKHILFTLRGCDSKLLNSNHHIRTGLIKASRLSGSKVMDVSTHCFSPQGVTSIALLSDSHMSIHTWPEEGTAVCDIFTCGSDTTPEKGVEYLKEWLNATDIESQTITRSL
tara:strand:- start:1059 stop:1391 length:333 start_codon:yes stop_codon:yes gene_type:complete